MGSSSGRPVHLRMVSVLLESVGKSLADLPPSLLGGIVRSDGDEERCPEVLGHGPSPEPATMLNPSDRGRGSGSQCSESDHDLPIQEHHAKGTYDLQLRP